MPEFKKKLDDMVPSEIVKSLDEYVVGQDEAKRTIAIAIRNRVRRKRLPEDVRDEVSPKNILMIGPTGVGKTEIARRIAKLANAPFIKVEATKYTEVGYVGRDVESMVRDLAAASISMVREEMAGQKEEEVERRVEERLLDLLLLCRSLFPAVPGIIIIAAVPVFLAVIFIMLPVIGNHVRHGKTVCIGHIVDDGMIGGIPSYMPGQRLNHPLVAL